MEKLTVQFYSAETLEETLDLLSELGDEGQVLAGGTDVMVQYQRGEIHPGALVHIERVRDLTGAKLRNGSVELGALVTHRAVTTDEQLWSLAPALVEAAATVGGWQTQEVGTIVGNVCNASPAADTVPPLLVADAAVHLAAKSGNRTLPLDEFLLGRRATARRPDELVVGLELETMPERSGEVYLKVGPRSAMEVALVGLAVRLTFAEDGQTLEDVRVAVCSVASIPFRAYEAESALTGSRLDAERLDEAAAALTAAADPIDDPRAPATYRRRILGPLLRRAVERCRDRAQGT